jgi:hypothetical protein
MQMTNLQATANKVANEVMAIANGTAVPQINKPTTSSKSASIKSRPSPPIRTSSRTKFTDTKTTANKPVRPAGISGRSQDSDISSSDDKRTPRSTINNEVRILLESPSATTGMDELSLDSKPSQRRGSMEMLDPFENQELVANNESRSSSAVHLAGGETTVMKGKAKDRMAQA